MAFEISNEYPPLVSLGKALCEAFDVEFILKEAKRPVRKTFRPHTTGEQRPDGTYVRDDRCQWCKGAKQVGKPCPDCDHGRIARTVVCPKCKGTGVYDLEPEKKCPTCRGEKTITHHARCETCDGTGYSHEPPLETCPLCEGKGYSISREYSYPWPVQEILNDFMENDFNHAYEVAFKASYLKAFRQKKHWWQLLHRYRWDDTPNTEVYLLGVKFPTEKFRKWVPDASEELLDRLAVLYREALSYKYDTGFRVGYSEGRYDVIDGRPCRYRYGGGQPD